MPIIGATSISFCLDTRRLVSVKKTWVVFCVGEQSECGVDQQMPMVDIVCFSPVRLGV